ncbi:MAG: efflux RND transporter permease subunit, partial [Bryobacteraceae bacterium]
MRLPEICVKRPVFAAMLIMFLVVMGWFSFLQLGVDLFPKSDAATAYVKVQMPGSSPEEMVSQVVLPLEEAIASISGIDELKAYVFEGAANIQVTFVLERDISEATEDVREKVSGAVRNLPPNVLPPVVQKADPDSDPVITLAVSGQRSVRELTEIADKQIRRAIETVDGVGGVDMAGGRKRQVNLMLDLNKLSAYSLTAQDVRQALISENIESPGGRIVRGPSEVGVRTLGRVATVNEFSDIIIKNVRGAPVRLRDVGYAEDAMAERRTFSYYQGRPSVTLDVRRQIGQNTVKVVESVQAKLETLRQSIPAGIQIDVIKEQATYIRSSVKALEEHLVLGSLLASIIVWLFIRNWRMVFISSIAIPTSIISTFSLMRIFDFTLNSMTLLGLTLAVGIVIDDAIIVLENIYRYIDEKDMDPYTAAIEATKEIAMAVVATTVSLVIIFVPIAFMTGYARKYVNQFGWTMAISIIVSMVVAFTLTPALSSRLLKRRVLKPGEVRKPHGHENTWTDRTYVAILGWSLRHRWVIVTIAVAVFLSTFVVNRYIGRDWMPQEDQNELSLSVELPEGTSLAATEKLALEVAERIRKIPGVIGLSQQTSNGFQERVNQASFTVLLKPQDERADILEMGRLVRQTVLDPQLARPRVNFPNILGGRDTYAPIRGMLLGPDVRVLVDYARRAFIEMVKEPSLSDVKANMNLNSPELHVVIDRPLASDLGVRVSDISGAVRLMMSGEDEISTFKEGSEQYPVTMRLLPGQRDDPQA